MNLKNKSLLIHFIFFPQVSISEQHIPTLVPLQEAPLQKIKLELFTVVYFNQIKLLCYPYCVFVCRVMRF